MSSIEQRLADVERRLAQLEASNNPPSLSNPQQTNAITGDPLVALTVSNKRFDASEYEEHIWFDCIYTLSRAVKPTRAVKGLLEFADLFGDVKFRIQATVNEPLIPGRPLAQLGIGFTYNQFMSEHQWMLGTNISDMCCSFKLMNALYADGTAETFA